MLLKNLVHILLKNFVQFYKKLNVVNSIMISIEQCFRDYSKLWDQLGRVTLGMDISLAGYYKSLSSYN